VPPRGEWNDWDQTGKGILAGTLAWGFESIIGCIYAWESQDIPRQLQFPGFFWWLLLLISTNVLDLGIPIWNLLLH
jgi:hypothetical protein